MVSALALAMLLTVSAPAEAQPTAGALRTCLADHTTGKDRKELARWIFLAMAAHPEMRPHVSATVATAADESSRALAALVTRLLTESCVKETRAAMQGGTGSLQIAFGGLGELAMQELMAEKTVQEAMGGFERYLDQKRLMEALAGK